MTLEVAVGLGQEHRAGTLVQRPAAHEVAGQRRRGFSGVAHHPRPAPLAGFGADGDEAVGHVEVGYAQGDQLLPAQGAVVGQREHQAVAQPLLGHLGEHTRPLRLGGDAGQPDQPADKAPLHAGVLGLAAAGGGILAARNGVPLPDALVDQVVIPQAHSREPLLQGRVADARPGQGTVRLAAEMTDEQRDVLKRGALSVHLKVLAETKILIEATAVGIDGCRRAAQVAEEGEPGPAVRRSCGKRIVRPDGSGHRGAPLGCGRILCTSWPELCPARTGIPRNLLQRVVAAQPLDAGGAYLRALTGQVPGIAHLDAGSLGFAVMRNIKSRFSGTGAGREGIG